MSELKGQLLGMILVFAIFGAIASILIASFKNAATKVGEQVGEEVTSQSSETSTAAKAAVVPLLSFED
jgi:hypothetical protein